MALNESKVYIVVELFKETENKVGEPLSDILEVYSIKVEALKSLEKFKKDYPEDSFDIYEYILEQ